MLPLGEEPLSIPLLQLFTGECALSVTCHLLCGLTKNTVGGTAFGPTSIMGILAIGPGVSQALFSQGHQHRSSEVRSQDHSKCVPGPTVGTMEAAQTLAQPR